MNPVTNNNVVSSSPTIEIVTALNSLKAVLFDAPYEQKFALLYVQRVRPELVNDNHMLGFLLADSFNVKVSGFSAYGPIPGIILLLTSLFAAACCRKHTPLLDAPSEPNRR